MLTDSDFVGTHADTTPTAIGTTTPADRATTAPVAIAIATTVEAAETELQSSISIQNPSK